MQDFSFNVVEKAIMKVVFSSFKSTTEAYSGRRENNEQVVIELGMPDLDIAI